MHHLKSSALSTRQSPNTQLQPTVGHARHAPPLSCGVSRHSMRFALIFFGCCSFGAAGECFAQDVVPPDSSVAIKLADEAISADGNEAVLNRELARSQFAAAFLDGYANPETTTGTVVNAYSLYSRMYGRGWTAGQAYRRAHPDSVAQIMHEYGYKDFDGAGSWTGDWEGSSFRPDSSAGLADSTSKTSCWHLAIFKSPEIPGQLKLLPRAPLSGAVTRRVRVTGYVSPLRNFDASGCLQQLYATSVGPDGD